MTTSPQAQLPAAVTVGEVARELRAVGGFFHVDCHDPLTAPPQPWQDLAELAQPAAFLGRVSATRTALAALAGTEPRFISQRAAVSITHLGLVARIISPVLALASRRALLLCLDLPRLRWQSVLGGPAPLSISAQTPVEVHAELAAMAAAIEARVLATSVADLTAVAAQLSVSSSVLWGNVASAVNGASTQLSRTPGAQSGGSLEGAAPGRAHQLQSGDLATALLNGPMLAGRHTGRSGSQFERRSCCLIHLVSPGPSRAVCGDCILRGGRAGSARGPAGDRGALTTAVDR